MTVEMGLKLDSSFREFAAYPECCELLACLGERADQPDRFGRRIFNRAVASLATFLNPISVGLALDLQQLLLR